jgi:acetylornithine deacetylase/succinyl-diaminopimelate desuccinylase-like protein
VLGIDAPATVGAANQLVPSARATISLRLAPGDDLDRAMTLLAGHFEARAPWGAEVAVQAGKATAPYRVDPAGPAFDAFRRACADAWGREPVETGIGGSMTLATAIAGLLPDAAVLLTGIQDPWSNAHAENESLHLGDYRAYCVAEALLLAYLAGQSRAR